MQRAIMKMEAVWNSCASESWGNWAVHSNCIKLERRSRGEREEGVPAEKCIFSCTISSCHWRRRPRRYHLINTSQRPSFINYSFSIHEFGSGFMSHQISPSQYTAPLSLAFLLARPSWRELRKRSPASCTTNLTFPPTDAHTPWLLSTFFPPLSGTAICASSWFP